MAGIGPISLKSRDMSACAGRSSMLAATANELEVFYNICVGKVIFRRFTNTLYFVDSPSVSVTDTILAVFKSFDDQPVINQLYMDPHKLIKAACCIVLQPLRVKPVLVALRLRGFHIDFMS